MVFFLKVRVRYCRGWRRMDNYRTLHMYVGPDWEGPDHHQRPPQVSFSKGHFSKEIWDSIEKTDIFLFQFHNIYFGGRSRI